MKNKIWDSITNIINELEFEQKIKPRRTKELEKLYNNVCERLGNTIGERIGEKAKDDFYELTDICVGIAGDMMQERYYTGVAVGLLLHNELKEMLDNPVELVKGYFAESVSPPAELYKRFYNNEEEGEAVIRDKLSGEEVKRKDIISNEKDNKVKDDKDGCETAFEGNRAKN